MEFNKLIIVGLGYIGLPTACTFANCGIEVVGVDVQESIVNSLNLGKTHILEPGLLTALENAKAMGNLHFSLTPQEADAFIIAVPTPFHDGKKADLSYVVAAAESIVPYLRKGNLVVLESTSPPMTTKNVLVPVLEKSGLVAGKDFLVAYSPERVLPGQILRELIENPRVIGGIDPESAEAGKNLYQNFVKGEIITTDSTTAEMVKLMENTFRDVNIALANELLRIGEKLGVNIWEAISIANLHPRVNILKPGPGVGGHCISVDPWFLVEVAPELTELIRTAREINDTQPLYVVNFLKNKVGNLQGKKIAVLGLSYKPDVDDVRESPSLEVIHLLQKEGATVKCYEPNKLGYKLGNITTTLSLEETIDTAEILLFLVSHRQFLQLDPQNIMQVFKGEIVFSTFQGLAKDSWKAAGYKLIHLGE